MPSEKEHFYEDCLKDGTHKVQRTATRVVQGYSQPMNGLGLFMNCLNDGLPVSNPLPIIAKLSALTNDIICINTQRGAAAKPSNTMDGFRQFAKNHPQLAMSALLQVPAAHPVITQGVTVHNLSDIIGLPTPEPFFAAQDEDPELDAMLERVLRGDDPGNFGNQFFPMDMGNSAQGFN
ncbi:a47b2785-884e-4228-8484-e6398b7de071 [Thermothielavioides terrestris]|uniref:A47b2785-884e-4228-8484-e6398b7de071 n=1 Tax=Thermothielavioides terrestris TaxID=2587410 RepID=A0A446BB43_9PEZI|nr:a47b2785-884e-4228-8484-e6398b7de071 [Thermothielavioides terrestris]